MSVFVISSPPLLENPDNVTPLNPLGINRSPYGEVFAMAMQGPIDRYWHGMDNSKHTCDDPESCSHHHLKADDDLAIDRYTGFNDRLRHFIDGMGEGLQERTNPRSATAGHKFFIRRGVEDKLRFAYNLDPSHYGNYNAYHFFLTEPELGTRPSLTPVAAKLAHETILYCLSQRTDPRQALTAASAAGNVIELMFNDRQVNRDSPNFSTRQMRDVLKVMDQAIGLYSHLSQQWDEQGLWKNLSELRLHEAEERFSFILKIRESQEEAIRRLEGVPDEQRLSSQDNSDTEFRAR